MIGTQLSLHNIAAVTTCTSKLPRARTSPHRRRTFRSVLPLRASSVAASRALQQIARSRSHRDLNRGSLFAYAVSCSRRLSARICRCWWSQTIASIVYMIISVVIVGITESGEPSLRGYYFIVIS